MKMIRRTLCLTLLAAGLLGLQVALPAVDGPSENSSPTSRSAAMAAGTTCRSIRPPAGSTSRTRPRSSSSTWTRRRSSAKSRPTPGVHGIAVAPDLGQGLRQRRPSELGERRRSEDAADHFEGGDRRQPGLHPLRAAAQGGLHVQRAAASPRPCSTRRPAPSRRPSRCRQAGVRRRGREGRRIYNNIEDTSEVVVIDTTTHRWSRRGRSRRARSASGLAIDSAHHRLFIGCGNKLMVMIDSTTGKVLSTLPIGAGRGCDRLRSGHRARVRVEQRRHADRGQGRGAANWRSSRRSPRRRGRGR